MKYIFINRKTQYHGVVLPKFVVPLNIAILILITSGFFMKDSSEMYTEEQRVKKILNMAKKPMELVTDT